MIDSSKLQAQTVKDLAEMAKRKGVLGWHSMRKDQLIRALVKHAKSPAAKRSKPNGRRTNGNGSMPLAKSGATTLSKAQSSRLQRRLNQIKAKLAHTKDLAFREGAGNGHVRDRLVVMVRDPYWLHAYWELGRQSIERARVAMGQHWHGARPVLRVHRVAADGTTSSVREVLRQIEVHGGVNNWYIDVQDPPKTYQLDIGYLAPSGKFFCLARSNVVSTPPAKAGETIDHNWAGIAKDCDRIYALSGGYSEESRAEELREVLEEHLRRPMGPPLSARLGLQGSNGDDRRRALRFEVDTELVIFGATEAGAHVTLRGEPVRVQPDGTFMVRLNLPDRRQVLPLVASGGDGNEQRTIVLAVERNTKIMEPQIREAGD